MPKSKGSSKKGKGKERRDQIVLRRKGANPRGTKGFASVTFSQSAKRIPPGRIWGAGPISRTLSSAYSHRERGSLYLGTFLNISQGVVLFPFHALTVADRRIHFLFQTYEYWTVNALAFEFAPTRGATAEGRIYMAADSDPSDIPDADTPPPLLSDRWGGVAGPANDSLTCHMPLRPASLRTMYTSPDLDGRRSWSAGHLVIGQVGTDAASEAELGDIIVHYDLVFTTPQMEETTSSATTVDRIESSGAVDSTPGPVHDSDSADITYATGIATPVALQTDRSYWFQMSRKFVSDLLPYASKLLPPGADVFSHPAQQTFDDTADTLVNNTTTSHVGTTTSLAGKVHSFMSSGAGTFFISAARFLLSALV